MGHGDNGEWRTIPLGEAIELKRGYDLPKHKRAAGSVPVISSSGPSDFHSEDKVKGPGVVRGRYGTLGEVFFVPGDFWPFNTTLYVRDSKGNDPRFIRRLACSGITRRNVHREYVHWRNGFRSSAGAGSQKGM